MRRRQPHLICLTEDDRSQLRQWMYDGRTAQRLARRARVLLAMEDPATVVHELAAHVAMTRSGIWRLCRRYEQEGLAIVEGASLPGRPRQISPLGAGAN